MCALCSAHHFVFCNFKPFHHLSSLYFLQWNLFYRFKTHFYIFIFGFEKGWRRLKMINFTPAYTVNFDESVLTHTNIEYLWPRNITITHDFIWCFQYAGDISTYNALHCGGCTVSPFHMTFTAHMVANFHFFIWHLPIMPLFYPLFFLLNFSFLSLFPCCVDSKAITLDLKVTRGGDTWG